MPAQSTEMMIGFTRGEVWLRSELNIRFKSGATAFCAWWKREPLLDPARLTRPVIKADGALNLYKLDRISTNPRR